MEIEAKGFCVNLEGAAFRKSTRSGPYSDNCVEVAGHWVKRYLRAGRR